VPARTRRRRANAAEQTLHFAYGPIKIEPGQNTIAVEENTLTYHEPAGLLGRLHDRHAGRPAGVAAAVTHGHLPESGNHGGRFAGLPDPRGLLARPVGTSGTVAINDFVHGQGDLTRPAGPPRAQADVRQPRPPPRKLAPGTYTCACRVHPFMRGAFEVERR
jgi:hypothetical protein